MCTTVSSDGDTWPTVRMVCSDLLRRAVQELAALRARVAELEAQAAGAADLAHRVAELEALAGKVLAVDQGLRALGLQAALAGLAGLAGLPHAMGVHAGILGRVLEKEALGEAGRAQAPGLPSGPPLDVAAAGASHAVSACRQRLGRTAT
jgi:hypothetical protein